MENVPKDVVELITNKLSPDEFLNYCKSKMGKKFCNNKDIWTRRIKKDFGVLLESRNNDKLLADRKSDPKKAYLDLFSKVSKAAETMVDEVYHRLGENFTKFLKKKYKAHLYQNYFDFLVNIISKIDSNNILDSVMIYIGDNQHKLMNSLPDIIDNDERSYRLILEEFEDIIRVFVEIFATEKIDIRGRRTDRSRSRSPSLSPRRSPTRSPQRSPQLSPRI
jgi:hypothetical protein